MICPTLCPAALPCWQRKARLTHSAATRCPTWPTWPTFSDKFAHTEYTTWLRFSLLFLSKGREGREGRATLGTTSACARPTSGRLSYLSGAKFGACP
jgi:hypothetical protein